MNKIVLFFVMLIYCSSGAQTNVFRKIAQRHDIYNVSAWKGVDSFRWDYNNSASLTQLTALRQDVSGNWNHLYRYTFTLNSNEKVTIQLRENWNGSSWINNTRYTYAYDLNNNIMLIHYDTWNGSVWNQTGKIEYTGYNSQHKYSLETYYIMNSGSWDFLTKNTYQYYPNEYQTMFEEHYSWNSSLAIWDSLERLYFTYYQDSIGTKTRLLPSGSGWLQQQKDIFTYSPAPILRTNYLIQKWDTTKIPNDWTDYHQIFYTYNSFNKLDKTNEKTYISSALPSYWIDDIRSQYLYNSDSLINEFYDETFTTNWTNHSKKTFVYSGKKIVEEKHYTGSGTTWNDEKNITYQYNAMDSIIFRQIDTSNGATFYPNNRDYYYYNIYPLMNFTLQDHPLEVTLFPNPANHVISFKCLHFASTIYSVSIKDAEGRTRMMISQPVFNHENKIDIPVNTLPTGNYSILIFDQNSGKQTIKKFQIKR